MKKHKEKVSVVTGYFNAKVMTRNDGETPIGLSEVGTKKTVEISMINLRKETDLASQTHFEDKETKHCTGEAHEETKNEMDLSSRWRIPT